MTLDFYMTVKAGHTKFLGVLGVLEISALTECELKRFSGAFRAGAPSPLACLPRARPFSLSSATSKRLLRRLRVSRFAKQITKYTKSPYFSKKASCIVLYESWVVVQRKNFVVSVFFSQWIQQEGFISYLASGEIRFPHCFSRYNLSVRRLCIVDRTDAAYIKVTQLWT